jgi:hypothetical protein
MFLQTLQSTVRRLYRWPNIPLSLSSVTRLIAVGLVYLWSAMLGLALLGLAIALASQVNIFGVLWSNMSALILVVTLLLILGSIDSSKMHAAFTVALICFFIGITQYMDDRCGGCRETVRTIEAGNYRDFTKGELIHYIYSLKSVQMNYFSVSVFFLTGLFLIYMTVRLGRPTRDKCHEVLDHHCA